MSDQSPTGKTAPSRATARKTAPSKATARKIAAPARKAAARAGRAASPPRSTVAPAGKTAAPARKATIPARSGPGPARNAVQVVEPAHRLRLRVPREFVPPLRAFRLPGLGLHVPLPERDQLPWIAGVMIVAALDLIDWPVAVLIAIGHAVATQSRNEAIRNLAEGIEAVA